MSLYFLVTLAILVVLIAVFVGSSSGSHDGARSAARRRKYVERNPNQVNTGDIRADLVAHGVSPEQARLVLQFAADHHIKALTMWRWLRAFDAKSLCVAIAADLTEGELVGHIEDQAVPHLDELKVFAGLNGLAVAGERLATPSARTTLTGCGMPQIFEPGEWPGELHVPMHWTSKVSESHRQLPQAGERRDDGLAA